ncbi:MAG: hypothetical protein U0457_08810 [Candidatus Sericytochromatia bacterium]
MSGGSLIGKYDPGYFSSYQEIKKGNKLAEFDSAEKAEDFAKKNNGAELVEIKNGKYEVYAVTASSGKALNNQAFVDNKVEVAQSLLDAQKSQGIKRAFFVTSDNSVRVLDSKTTQVNSINQEYLNFQGAVTVKDKDGIAKNSKNDLEVNLKGNLKVSKKVFEELANKLSQLDLPTVGKLDFSVDFKNGEYKISASKGVGLADITMKPDPSGNGLICDVDAYGFGGYVADEIKKQMSGYGFSATNTDSSDKFILKPNFKNNSLIPQFKVGNMNMNFEQVDETKSKSTFKLNTDGMDIAVDLNGIGSSDATKAVANPNERADKIQADIKSVARSDMSSSSTISNGTIDASIAENERDGLANQLEGFGQKNVRLSGDIKVTNINTQVETDAAGKVKVNADQKGVKIESNGINFEDPNSKTKIKIDGASGNLGYQQNKDGGFSVGIGEGQISGSFEKPNFSASVKELKADGNFTYMPKNGNNPEKYRIQGNSVEVGDLKVKAGQTDYALKNLSLKNAHVDINPTNGSVNVEANTGTTAQINGLKIGESVNISGALNGSISFDPKTNETTINGDTANLRGRLGDFSLDNLNARGKVTLGADGSVALADMQKFDFKLANGNKDSNLNGLEASGKNLRIHRDPDGFNISSGKNKPAELSAYYPKTKTDAQKDLTKNLTFSGSVDIKDNGIVKVNAGTTLHSGNAGGVVSFNQLKFDKELNLDKASDVMKIDSPISFSGEVKSNGVGVKDFKFNNVNGNQNGGSITFDKKSGNVSINGEADFKLALYEGKGKPTEGNISFAGKIDVKKEGNKYIIESADKSKINLDLKGVNLKDFEFQGRLVVDGNNITLEKPADKPEMVIKGNLNGRELDLKATGNLVFSNQKGETSITANNAKISGNLAGFNVNPVADGINGKVTFTKDSKLPKVEGLNLGIEVDGVKLETKNGSVNQKADGGYVINVPAKIEGGNGKIDKLLEKVTNEIATTPEQKAKLTSLRTQLSTLDLNKVKLDEFKIELDKDLKGFNIKASSSDFNIDFSPAPDKKVTLSNNKTGKVDFELNDKGEVFVSSTGAKLNGTLNGVELKDVSIKGGIKYTPANGTNQEKVSLLANKNSATPSGIDIDGTLVFKDQKLGSVERQLKLSADADVTLTRKGKDLEIQSDNMKLDGMFNAFKLKTLPLEGKDTSFASGKLTLREDGRFDLSKLNFKFDVDGIIFSNKDGGFSTKVGKNKAGQEEKTYEVKLSGDVNTKLDNLSKFLAKASSDEVMPESVKNSTKNILSNMQNILKSGNADINYDLTLGLNSNFGIDSMRLNNDVNVKKAQVKMDSMGMHGKTITLDNLHVTADAKLENKEGNFSVKGGTIDFALTDKVKEQIANNLKETLKDQIIATSPKILGAKRDKIHLDVQIASNGAISVSGKVDDVNIVSNVDMGARLNFEGTKINIDLDKLKTGNFIGSVVQFFYSGARKEGVMEKVAENFQKTGVAADYNGKTRISIDLQSTMSKMTEGAVKITDFQIKDNKVLLKYDADYGGSSQANKPEINNFSKTFETLAKKKNLSEEEGKSLVAEASKLSADELSAAMEKITFSPEKIRNLDKASEDFKVVNTLMQELYNKKDSARNKDHLIRIIDSLNKNNKSTFRDFIEFIKNQEKADRDVILAVNRKIAELR